MEEKNKNISNINNIPWKERLAEAEQAQDKGQYDLAANICDELLSNKKRTHGEKARIYNVRGRINLDRDRNLSAYRDFTSAITVAAANDTNLANYYNSRAVAAEKLSPSNPSLLALEDYNEAIRLNSKNSVFFFNRANYQCKQKDFIAAFGDYTQALQLDPENENIRKEVNNLIISLTLLYKNIQKSLEISKNDQESLSLYAQLLKICEFEQFAKHRAEVIYQRALFYKKIKKVQLALADCESAIRLNGKDGRFFYLKGLLQKGEEAVAAYQKAISLDSKKAEYHIALGKAYVEIQEYQLAVNSYNAAIMLDDTQAFYHWEKAEVFSKLRQKKEAIQAYTQAINLQPTDSALYANRALLQLDICQYTEAKADLKKAISLNRNNADYYNILGNLFLETGENDSAFKRFSQTLFLTPKLNKKDLTKDDSWYFKCKGFIALYTKKYDKALNYYNKAIELRPDQPEYHFQKGVILFALNKLSEAATDFDKVTELEQNSEFKKYSERAKAYKQTLDKIQENSPKEKIDKAFGFNDIKDQLVNNSTNQNSLNDLESEIKNIEAEREKERDVYKNNIEALQKQISSLMSQVSPGMESVAQIVNNQQNAPV